MALIIRTVRLACRQSMLKGLDSPDHDDPLGILEPVQFDEQLVQGLLHIVLQVGQVGPSSVLHLAFKAAISYSLDPLQTASTR